MTHIRQLIAANRLLRRELPLVTSWQIVGWKDAWADFGPVTLAPGIAFSVVLTLVPGRKKRLHDRQVHETRNTEGRDQRGNQTGRTTVSL